MVQTEFRPVVEDALTLSRKRFGSDMRAVYLAGSVGAGETLPGISDIDWFCFIDAEPTPLDLQWAQEIAGALRQRHPVAAVDFHMNLFSVERLRRESFWRFICRYNTLRVYGRDLLAELERGGVAVPCPGPDLAASRRSFVRRCLEQAMRGETPSSLAPLPQDRALATRKLARNFVVVEGAFLLMVDGVFVSFSQEAVLNQLQRRYPAWGELVELTRRIMACPQEVGMQPADYMKLSSHFVQYILNRLEDVEQAAAPIAQPA